MSKLNIGVGDEFPLDESPAGEDRHAWKDDHRGMRHALRGWRHAHHHWHHHGHHHHHHGEEEEMLLHLRLMAALARWRGHGRFGGFGRECE